MKLSVIEGGASDRVDVGSIAVIAAPLEEPPFAIDARIFEEDTYLVLSAPADVPDVRGSPIHLFHALWNLDAVPTGTVVVKQGTPPKILAVVHDLDRSPTVLEAEVSAALKAAFTEAARRNWKRLALPLLGSVHHGITEEASLRALAKALPEATSIEGLWIITARERTYSTIESLRAVTR